MHLDLLNPPNTPGCSDGHGFPWATDRPCKQSSSWQLAIVQPGLAQHICNRSAVSRHSNPRKTQTVLQNDYGDIELSDFLSVSRI